MVSATSIQAINEQLARQINQEARENPNSPYAHKYVGIVDGKVVLVANSLREADLGLDEIQTDPARCYIVDASADYDTVQEIWSDY
jgi:hypothetical protein